MTDAESREWLYAMLCVMDLPLVYSNSGRDPRPRIVYSVYTPFQSRTVKDIRVVVKSGCGVRVNVSKAPTDRVAAIQLWIAKLPMDELRWFVFRSFGVEL